MLNWLKWLIAGKELRELEIRRQRLIDYQRWLAEFPDVSLVLKNMQIEIDGMTPLDVCYPPGKEGPWDIANLAIILRRLKS